LPLQAYIPNAVIAQRITLTEHLIILKIKPRGWAIPAFAAGQFTQLGLSEAFIQSHVAPGESTLADADKLIKRSYSVASAPETGEYLEFYINLVPGGTFTPALFSLTVGDTLWMNPVFDGRLVMTHVPRHQRLFMIATGTGIGPFLSMLRSTELDLAARQVDLIHGVRYPADLAYADELRTLAADQPNFRYYPVVSRAGESALPWTGDRGHVQNVWQRHFQPLVETGALTPENTHIFLCGNPAMVMEMLGDLQASGFPRHLPRQPGAVHIERYW
jgi:ferredoxin--NADP+ reductase